MGALDLSVSATLNVAHAVPPAPAPWVSWRVYRPHNGGCRALLLNLRTREFLLLEDAAAAYWELLCQRPANWSEMAGRLELAEADVVAFAQELTDANLLSAPDSAATATVAHGEDARPPGGLDAAPAVRQGGDGQLRAGGGGAQLGHLQEPRLRPRGVRGVHW